MTNPINNAGYFKDIFPDGVKLCKNIAGLGKETFNNTIKDALLNKKRYWHQHWTCQKKPCHKCMGCRI